MPRSIDPDSFGFVVTDLARLMRAEMDRRTAAAGLGLTPGETRALAHAARAGAVRQNALAERMGVEAMTLSSYIDRLEARGLVVREADPQDRRAKIVRPTEAADPVLQQIKQISAELRRELGTALPPGRWEELRASLIAIRDELARLRPDCPRPGQSG